MHASLQDENVSKVNDDCKKKKKKLMMIVKKKNKS